VAARRADGRGPSTAAYGGGPPPRQMWGRRLRLSDPIISRPQSHKAAGRLSTQLRTFAALQWLLRACVNNKLSSHRGSIMPVENDPMYPKWKAALDRLTETKLAVERGDASDTDLSAAQTEYDNVCDEIDGVDRASGS